jgi:BASS family bile acid:Na+ symporter
MDFASNILLPIALAVLMFAIGLALTPSDFRRVVVERRAVVVGLGTLLAIVPLLGLLIASATRLEPPVAMGLFMVSTCPGGTFSNLLTVYGKGDLPLSITMTALGSLLYVVTAPLWVSLGLSVFVGAQTHIHLSHATAFFELSRIIVLPVAAGMIARRWLNASARTRIERLLRDGAAAVIVTIFLFIFWRIRAALDVRALPPVLILNVCTVLLGWGVARAARVARPAVTSIVCEHAVRQEGTAIYIATALLALPTAALPLLLNSVVGLAIGSSFIAFQAWRGARDVRAVVP